LSAEGGWSRSDDERKVPQPTYLVSEVGDPPSTFSTPYSEVSTAEIHRQIIFFQKQPQIM